MKIAIIIAAVLGVACAQRPHTLEVINKFREVAPHFFNSSVTGESEAEAVRQESSDAIAKFHVNIIMVKEQFVLETMKQERAAHHQLANQHLDVDQNCLGFLNTTLDMSVNLAGTGYTNCVNDVDRRFNNISRHFYINLGSKQVRINSWRLLDVFRDDNVFYTPQNIIRKLADKANILKGQPEAITKGMQQDVGKFATDLEALRISYVECMDHRTQGLKEDVKEILKKLIVICLGEHVPTTTPEQAPNAIQAELTEPAVQEEHAAPAETAEHAAPAETEEHAALEENMAEHAVDAAPESLAKAELNAMHEEPVMHEEPAMTEELKLHEEPILHKRPFINEEPMLHDENKLHAQPAMLEELAIHEIPALHEEPMMHGEHGLLTKSKPEEAALNAINSELFA